MKTFLVVLTLSGIVAACSSKPEVVHLRTVKGAGANRVNKVHSNAKVVLEIEGMTCEMGCGSSIRTELKATGGVDRVQYDFVDGRKVQKATISFDDKLVSVDEMIKIISTMNDKQFKVAKSKDKQLEIVEFSENCVNEEKAEVDANDFSVNVPNLFDILRDVVSL